MENENYKKASNFYREENYKQAFIYFQKADKENYFPAKLNLAQMYFFGKGTKQDYVKARSYYEQASSKSHLALLNLGVIYFNAFGVKQDYEQAREYYSLAAKMGNKKAKLNLADMYFHAYGGKQDKEKAKKLYEELKDEALAKFALGELYLEENNLEQALFYYEEAAKAKESSAIQALAYLYYSLGAFSQAKEKFLLLKALDYKESYFYLANIFYFEASYQNALKYYEKALEFGKVEAYLGLGNLAYFGYLEERNLLLAKEYFLKISAHPLAKARLALLKKMGV